MYCGIGFCAEVGPRVFWKSVTDFQAVFTQTFCFFYCCMGEIKCIFKKISAMKTFFLLLFALFISVGMSACDDGDDFNDMSQKIKLDILRAFEQKFPQASDVDWDKQGKYLVAEFKSPMGTEVIAPGANPQVLYEMEAWFDHAGNWRMTVMDVTYDLLPHNVQMGFVSSDYSGWKVVGTTIVQRNGQDTLYILEVKNNGYVHQLFFDPLGKLAKVNKHPSDDYSHLI